MKAKYTTSSVIRFYENIPVRNTHVDPFWNWIGAYT